jgi:hypothetical protein
VCHRQELGQLHNNNTRFHNFRQAPRITPFQNQMDQKVLLRRSTPLALFHIPELDLSCFLLRFASRRDALFYRRGFTRNLS